MEQSHPPTNMASPEPLESDNGPETKVTIQKVDDLARRSRDNQLQDLVRRGPRPFDIGMYLLVFYERTRDVEDVKYRDFLFADTCRSLAYELDREARRRKYENDEKGVLSLPKVDPTSVSSLETSLSSSSSSSDQEMPWESFWASIYHCYLRFASLLSKELVADIEYITRNLPSWDKRRMCSEMMRRVEYILCAHRDVDPIRIVDTDGTITRRLHLIQLALCTNSQLELVVREERILLQIDELTLRKIRAHMDPSEMLSVALEWVDSLEIPLVYKESGHGQTTSKLLGVINDQQLLAKNAKFKCLQVAHHYGLFHRADSYVTMGIVLESEQLGSVRRTLMSRLFTQEELDFRTLAKIPTDQKLSPVCSYKGDDTFFLPIARRPRSAFNPAAIKRATIEPLLITDEEEGKYILGSMTNDPLTDEDALHESKQSSILSSKTVLVEGTNPAATDGDVSAAKPTQQEEVMPSLNGIVVTVILLCGAFLVWHFSFA